MKVAKNYNEKICIVELPVKILISKGIVEIYENSNCLMDKIIKVAHTIWVVRLLTRSMEITK